MCQIWMLIMGFDGKEVEGVDRLKVSKPDLRLEDQELRTIGELI